MSKNIKGITIELDGETKGLDKALQSVNKRSRDLNSELREVERSLKFNPGNAELVAQKQRILGEQAETTSKKLKQLRDAQEQVNDQFAKGKINQSQYDAFQREIIETQSKLDNFEGKLKSTQSKVESFGDKMKNTGDKMKGIGDGMKNAGSSMSTSFTAPILGGLALVTKGTEEYRQDLARLEQNALDAGISSDVLSQAFTRLSGVSEETDSNVEALSNLMASGLDEQGMLLALDALSGAMIKFPDTMKIEGLADGLQETMATGKAIGPFAEMLERLGFDLDVFNIGLENAIQNGDAQNYILQNLANTGLTQVNEKYRENNAELVKSREEQQKFQDAMATLGATLTPIVTAITEKISALVNWFNNLDSSTQKVILVVIGLVAAIGPLLLIIGGAITAIGSLITIAGTLGIGIGALVGIVAGVVAAIAALITIGVLLYKNWDEIKANAVKVWTDIKNFFITTFNTLDKETNGAFTKIKNIIDKALNTVWTIIQSVWKLIEGTFKNTLAYLKAVVTGDFDGMKKAVDNQMELMKGVIKVIWNAIKEYFSYIMPILRDLVSQGFQWLKDKAKEKMEEMRDKVRDVWEKVEDFFKNIDLKAIGEDIIQGLIDGVGAMKDKLLAKAEGIAEKVKKVFTGLFDIHSPSRWMRDEIGKNLMLGLAKGIEDNSKYAEKAAKDSGEEIIRLSEWQAKEMNKIAELGQEEKYKALESWINKHKQLENIRVKDEINLWNYANKQFELSGEEQKRIALNLRDAKTRMYNEIKSAGESYVDSVKTINQKLIDEEKKLNDVYEKSLEDRTKSLYSFVGIFDEIQTKTEVSGKQLIDNLKGQVDTFSNWARNISQLASKGIDEGLLEELRQMGPKAAAEIAALNSLTEKQLQEYEYLWKEKNRLAREQATEELQGLKEETQNKIEELHHQTAEQLEKLRVEWVNKMKGIKDGTLNEFDILNATMPEIGENIIDGLINGLDSKTTDLLGKLGQITSTIQDAITDAFDINSPSRWMRDEIGKNMMTGWIQGIESMRGKVQSMTDKMGEMMKPEVPSMPNMNPVTASSGTSYGNVYVNIQAKDVQEFNNVVDFFKRLPQATKAY
jgi:phage-related minor tail protein